MKALNIFNPQKWIGQIILLILWGSTAFFGGSYWAEERHDCPAQTVVNQGKIKAKKGSSITNDVEFNSGVTDCEEFIRGLKMSEIRFIRKSEGR